MQRISAYPLNHDQQEFSISTGEQATIACLLFLNTITKFRRVSNAAVCLTEAGLRATVQPITRCTSAGRNARPTLFQLHISGGKEEWYGSERNSEGLTRTPS